MLKRKILIMDVDSERGEVIIFGIEANVNNGSFFKLSIHRISHICKRPFAFLTILNL